MTYTGILLLKDLKYTEWNLYINKKVFDWTNFVANNWNVFPKQNCNFISVTFHHPPYISVTFHHPPYIMYS